MLVIAAENLAECISYKRWGFQYSVKEGQNRAPHPDPEQSEEDYASTNLPLKPGPGAWDFNSLGAHPPRAVETQ